MRRALVSLAVLMLTFAVATPDAGAHRPKFKTKAVDGELTGAGGFVFEGNCPLVVVHSSGEYHVKHLGRGTWTLHFCVVSASGPFHFTGTLDFVTRKGAQLHGVIDADVLTPLLDVPVTINGGTKRFKNATGSLLLDINQFNQTNCEPRVGVCFNWDELDTITGEITVRRRH
jgi:hypothetical protein